MIKGLGATAAAVTVAALAVSSVAPATGGSLSSASRDTIRVVATTAEEDTAYIDLGATGESIGDMFVFSSTLTRHGRTVGHAGVVCTVVSMDPAEAQCLGTASFRNGQITVQGLVPDASSRFDLAITGGTGRYEGAGGTLTVHEVSDTREVLTFHLTD
jgi:hypothetical protein